MRLETCKGTYEGTMSDCAAWLQEMQPAFASVAIGHESEPLEPERYHDDWSEALIVAIGEIECTTGRKVAR